MGSIKRDTLLTQKVVRELLDYEPVTGILTWRKTGKRAGSAPSATRKYRKVKVAGEERAEQLVIWLWMTGEWPAHEVDHENRDGRDNRWGNLRPATRSQNQQNTRLYRNSTTGLRGVTYCKRNGRFAAAIRRDSHTYWLGYFDCPAAAHFAYLIAQTER